MDYYGDAKRMRDFPRDCTITRHFCEEVPWGTPLIVYRKLVIGEFPRDSTLLLELQLGAFPGELPELLTLVH